MNETKIEREEVACAGHFIGARDCGWHKHTQVGCYRISSVGDYRPMGHRTQLGAGPDFFYETFVFRTSEEFADPAKVCRCRVVTSWSEVEGMRYATEAEALAGHEAIVARYQEK